MIFEIFLETENEKINFGKLDFSRKQTLCAQGIELTTDSVVAEGYKRVDMRVTSGQKGFITVRCTYEDGNLYTFSGKKDSYGVFRQSPHDVTDHIIATPKEAVPMVGLEQDGELIVLFSDNPAVYENYTTQTVCPEQKYFELSSGDSGAISGGQLSFAPHYQDSPHFTIVCIKSKAKTLLDMRKDVFYAIDKTFGKNEFSKFHAICFSSNYMHYRANETGSSKYWVVPGIDYCNKQYPRDAFWQSMIFPVEMEQQCYDGVYKGRYAYAENALIFLVWSYRLKLRGGTPDPERILDAWEYIKAHISNNAYITGEPENNPAWQYAFRSWYDLCSFENNDVVAYNQGLFAVALLCAEKLGLRTEVNAELAIEKYNSMFLTERGYIPISEKKPQVLCLDSTVGDLLSYLLFGRKLLRDEIVTTHYRTVFSAARTPYGAKITCRENGDYCSIEDYSAYGSFLPDLSKQTFGDYSWGGSYYLYEMLFHIDAHIHGVKEAEENIIERSSLDFRIGGTYFEHVNTVTGEGKKPNQGWNCCVYPIWQVLIERGVSSDRFFKEMDKLL